MSETDTSIQAYRAPRSVLRPSVAAIVATLILAGVTLSVLPLFEALSARDYETVTLRAAPDVAPPPPVWPERRPQVPEESPTEPQPRLVHRKPRLQRPRQPIRPLMAQLSLSMARLEPGFGDFALDFDLAPELAEVPADCGPGIFELSQLDSAPRAIVQMHPIYPRSARRNRIEGFVEISFVITREGKVTDITIVRSEPGSVFVDAARAAARRWRFTRPQRDDKPVAVRARQIIRFQLQ